MPQEMIPQSLIIAVMRTQIYVAEKSVLIVVVVEGRYGDNADRVYSGDDISTSAMGAVFVDDGGGVVDIYYYQTSQW